MNRKEFFRKGLLKAILTVEEKANQIGDAVRQSLADVSPNSEGSAIQIDRAPSSRESWKNRPEKNLDVATPVSNWVPKGLVRPPGAVEESEFLHRCTGCGDCIALCPYGVVIPVSIEGRTTPFLEPNSKACMLCDGYPCISACETKALLPIPEGKYPIFGKAKPIFKHCINAKTGEKTCEACKEACPVPKAVVFKKEKPSFTKACVGCGQCVQVCPSFPKAINIKELVKAENKI